MKRLIKHFWKEYLLITLALIVSTISNLAVAFITANIINAIINFETNQFRKFQV